MRRMPNGQYYESLARLSDAKFASFVQQMLLYASLELLSLLVVAWILQRRVGVSVLHQLAFVLESRWLVIQSKLVVWTVIVLQYPLAHFGVGAYSSNEGASPMRTDL